MYRYETPYVFREYPKIVHGVICHDENDELAAIDAHAERVKAVKALEEKAKEQAIGEMQEAIRREKKAK